MGYSQCQCTFIPSLLKTCIHGFNAVPCSVSDSNSYRGELAGLLGAITLVNTLCHQHNITGGLCTIYCDNKGALAASFGSKRPVPRWSSYDLVSMIHYQLQLSPIQWRPQHIRGHQDTSNPFRDLSLAAQGNVLADFLTANGHKRYLEWPVDLLPGESW